MEKAGIDFDARFFMRCGKEKIRVFSDFCGLIAIQNTYLIVQCCIQPK